MGKKLPIQTYGTRFRNFRFNAVIHHRMESSMPIIDNENIWNIYILICENPIKLLSQAYTLSARYKKRAKLILQNEMYFSSKYLSHAVE